jgi:hypothetical protein
MKNTLKLFGIIALAAVFAFSFVSCDDSSDDNSGGNIDGDLIGKWFLFDGEELDDDSWIEIDATGIKDCKAGTSQVLITFVASWDLLPDGVEFIIKDNKIGYTVGGVDSSVGTYTLTDGVLKIKIGTPEESFKQKD